MREQWQEQERREAELRQSLQQQRPAAAPPRPVPPTSIPTIGVDVPPQVLQVGFIVILFFYIKLTVKKSRSLFCQNLVFCHFIPIFFTKKKNCEFTFFIFVAKRKRKDADPSDKTENTHGEILFRKKSAKHENKRSFFFFLFLFSLSTSEKAKSTKRFYIYALSKRRHRDCTLAS